VRRSSPPSQLRRSTVVLGIFAALLPFAAPSAATPSQPLVRRSFTVAKDGFDGVYVAPRPGATHIPVLAIAGSAGGLASSMAMAEDLAARGIPALGIAYFDRTGLATQSAYHRASPRPAAAAPTK
jgi:hypothetical protein